MWKRYSSRIQHRWGITEYCSLAEPPRPQYLSRLKNIKKMMFNIATGAQEPSPPFWTKKFPSFLYSYSVIFLFVCIWSLYCSGAACEAPFSGGSRCRFYLR